MLVLSLPKQRRPLVLVLPPSPPVLATFPFYLTAPFRSSTQVQVLEVRYCNTVPLKMQNALNIIKLQKKISRQCIQLQKKKKKGSNLFHPRPPCLRQGWCCSNPIPHSHRKSSNIYIFNPIKNVKKRKKNKKQQPECTTPRC